MKYHVFNEIGQLVRGGLSEEIAKELYDARHGHGYGGWVEDDSGKIVYGKYPIGKIDITPPTWVAMLPVMLHALTHGTDKGKALAMEELQRMAELADELKHWRDTYGKPFGAGKGKDNADAIHRGV